LNVGFRLATAAMATRFELLIPEPETPALRAAGEDALEAIEECDRRLSRFRRDGLPAHVERHASTRPVRLDVDTFELLALALDVHARTAGAFDVAHAGPGSSADLVLDRAARTLRLRRPLTLDLGALAKGHALELAARALRAGGVERAFLHGGTSSALALGAPEGADGWRVALAGTTRVVRLRDRALSVSAQRGRAHVRDPRTGTPVAGGCCAWTVARDARVAEAWSTAALVLGRACGADDDARIEACGLEDDGR